MSGKRPKATTARTATPTPAGGKPLSWLALRLAEIVGSQIDELWPTTDVEFDEIEQIDALIETKMKDLDLEMFDFAVIDPKYTSSPSDESFGYTEIPYVGKWRTDHMNFRKVRSWFLTLGYLSLSVKAIEARADIVRFLGRFSDGVKPARDRPRSPRYKSSLR